MISLGHTFNELFGKNNPQTTELRFTEQIVGPVQSQYSGHIAKQNFAEYIKHLDFEMPQNILDNCLSEIEKIMNVWSSLALGQNLTLNWEL